MSELIKGMETEPCPFCGNSELYTGTVSNPDAYWDSALRGEEYGYVACCDCGCIVKADTIDDAVRTWNTRVTHSKKKAKKVRREGETVRISGSDGTCISIQHLPGKVKPCLIVQFASETRRYPVASFVSDKTALWFCEVVEEVLSVTED